MHRNLQPNPQKTAHFVERAATRGLPRDVAPFAMQWGTEVRACKAISVTVLERDLPGPLQETDLALRAKQLAGRGALRRLSADLLPAARRRQVLESQVGHAERSFAKKARRARVPVLAPDVMLPPPRARHA